MVHYHRQIDTSKYGYKCNRIDSIEIQINIEKNSKGHGNLGLVGRREG